MKTLLISGSPRNGNTEFILNKIYDSLRGEKELILLKNKNIQHCKGCLACDKTKKCVIDDDMTEILNKMIWADTIIVGTPSYYYNVSGLLKDFIDRTNPLYETNKLKGKKALAIICCGGKDKKDKAIGGMIKNYTDCYGIKFINSYCFSGLLKPNSARNDSKTIKKIGAIVKKIEK